MKTIKLTNEQAQNLYFSAKDDMYELISAPSWERIKKRLMRELDKIGGFETEYCGKPSNLTQAYEPHTRANSKLYFYNLLSGKKYGSVYEAEQAEVALASIVNKITILELDILTDKIEGAII